MPLSPQELMQMTAMERQGYLLSMNAGMYFARDEALRVRVATAFSNATVTVTGTFFSVSEGYTVFRRDFTPDADRVPNNLIIPMTEGLLLSLAVRTTADGLQPGQMYCRVHKLRSAGTQNIELAQLISGYISQSGQLGWPGAVLQQPGEGRGNIRSITGTDPAAGSEISETVPTNALWRVITLRASFVADGTSATRSPSLIFTDGTNVLFKAAVGIQATSSQTVSMTWGEGLQEDASIITLGTATLPRAAYLREGFTVETETAHIQAGDNWSAPQLLVEEWIFD